MEFREELRTHIRRFYDEDLISDGFIAFCEQIFNWARMIRVLFLIVLYLLLPFVYLFAGLYEGVLAIWGVMSGIWASLWNITITVLEPCYAIIRRLLKLTLDYRADSLDNIAEAIRGRETEFLPTTMKTQPASTTAYSIDANMKKRTTTTTTTSTVPTIDPTQTYQGYQNLEKNTNEV